MFRLQKGLKINNNLTENELTLSLSFTNGLKINNKLTANELMLSVLFTERFENKQQTNRERINA